MRFIIKHNTRYGYSSPVLLGPQQLRFYPRDNGYQRLIDHQLNISPEPAGRNEQTDLEGNRVTHVWFEQETDYLDIRVSMVVETLQQNPFNFILEPEATVFPVEYGRDILLASAYLERIQPDDEVTTFATELACSVNYDTLAFLNELNRHLFVDYTLIHRESGEPQMPVFTMNRRTGACRDLAVLFIECCRARGIAARFVSGYQKGDLQKEKRYLHAWPEVYLPGAGWCGFDPTHGIAIADTHVTIAAAALPRDTMPVSGGFIGADITSKLDYVVEIQVE